MTGGLRLAVLAIVVCSCVSCALFGKGQPLAVRYFTPEQPSLMAAPLSASAVARDAAALGPRLRLGRVRSASHLGEPIAYRATTHEVGFYDDRRWTEEPAEYVRRALANALFEDGGFVRATGAAPTLEVELLAFEEARPSNVARITLRIALLDGRGALFEETFTAERVASGPSIEALVSAMSEALMSAAGTVAAQVARALR